MTDKSKKLVITTDELPDLPLPGTVPQASPGGSPAAGLPSVAGVKPAPMAVGFALGGLTSSILSLIYLYQVHHCHHYVPLRLIIPQLKESAS